MAEISSPKDLEEWLKDKPKECAQVLANRCALRVVPVLGSAIMHSNLSKVILNNMTLATMRASLLLEMLAVSLIPEIEGFANNAAIAADVVGSTIAPDSPLLVAGIALDRGTAHAAGAAVIASARAIDAPHLASYAVLKTLSAYVAPHGKNSADAAGLAAVAASAADAALENDVRLLLNYEGYGYSPLNLLSTTLWQGTRNPLLLEWQSLKESLKSFDNNWHFWIDWYQAKLDGTLHPGLTQSQKNDLYYQIATFPNELWEEGAEAINQRIAELMEEVKEGEGNDFEEETDEPYELELPPQNKAALTFKTNEDGQAQLAPASENEQVLSDEGAKARHEETLYSGEELIRLFDPNKTGANAVAPLIEKTQRCLDALGKTPQEVDIDRLIPRGEALRQIANREENRDDFTDVPPLPDGFKEALNNFLAAYNPYIALDPVLEKRDQIRLGPDEKGQLITTVEGQVIIDALTEANLLEEDTKDILDEVTNTAEGSTDPESRANRYYSESLRNLGRNILTEVDKAYKSIKNKGKIASEVCFDAVVVGAALIHQDFARKRAQIILKHEKWFVKNFGRTLWMKKMMVGFIHRIKTNPLLTDDDN